MEFNKRKITWKNIKNDLIKSYIYPGKIRIHEFSWFFVITIRNQPSIIIHKGFASYITFQIRNKTELFSLPMAVETVSRMDWNNVIKIENIFPKKKRMKLFKKKTELGKKISCAVYAGYGSIKDYENGFQIKPNKQESIFLSRSMGEVLALHIRSKCQFITLFEFLEKKTYEKMRDL